jgi:hypothetical protein
VLQVAQQVHDAEERIRAAIAQGTPLRQARKDEGYHSLQTRK